MKGLVALCFAVSLSALAVGGPVCAEEQGHKERVESYPYPLAFGGHLNEVSLTLDAPQSNQTFLVKSAIKPVIAEKYDTRLQLSRMKDFILNPNRFSNSKILYLYDIKSLSEDQISKMLELASRKDIGAYFLARPTKLNSIDFGKSFIGTTFDISIVDTGAKRIGNEARKFDEDSNIGELKDSVMDLAQTSINKIAPKSWEDFGASSKIYIAFDQPVPDLNGEELALSYQSLVDALKKY